jgi:amidohydrolase
MLETARLTRVRAAVEKLEPELIAFRRDLHRHPELGWAEIRTTRKLVERLEAAGLQPEVMPRGTGVICDVGATATRRPTVGLRGDMDALPVQDETEGDYRSEIDGVCHACGHDAHTTSVLGAGLALAALAADGLQIEPVRLIFQSAEEQMPCGAVEVIRHGYIDGLDRLYALHCDPKIVTGQFGFRVGAITAAATRLRIEIEGPGGHTARPHLGADLVFAFGEVLSRLPGMLSRRYDPRAVLSLVWGQIHAGAAANAMPSSGFAEGTLRTLDVHTWMALTHDVPEMIESILAPLGVKADIELDDGSPPCVNDAAVIDELRGVAIGAFGRASATDTDQSMGGEDFSWMLQRRPGALVRLGVRPATQATAPDLHQGRFDIDEHAIGIGTLFLTLAAQSPGRHDRGANVLRQDHQ